MNNKYVKTCGDCAHMQALNTMINQHIKQIWNIHRRSHAIDQTIKACACSCAYCGRPEYTKARLYGRKTPVFSTLDGSTGRSKQR